METKIRAIQQLLTALANDIKAYDQEVSNQMFLAAGSLQAALAMLNERVTYELDENEKALVNEGDRLEAVRRFRDRNKCSIRLARDRINLYDLSDKP